MSSNATNTKQNMPISANATLPSIAAFPYSSTHALERSASEQDLSFVVLGDHSTCSTSGQGSVGSSQSLPDLTSHHAVSHIPPSYYQICLSDLFQIKSIQQQQNQLSNRNKNNEQHSQANRTLNTDSSTALIRRMTDEVVVLREENIRLLGLGMKNDQSLQSMLSKHQSIINRLTELKEENQLLRKQNSALEEKVEKVIHDMKLIQSEVSHLKANPTAATDSNQSTSYSQTSSLMENKMAIMEARLSSLAQQNVELSHQLESWLPQVAGGEQARVELADKIAHLNDQNLLLQMKLFTLDSKMILLQHNTQSSLQNSVSNTSNPYNATSPSVSNYSAQYPIVTSPTLLCPPSPQFTVPPTSPQLYPDLYPSNYPSVVNSCVPTQESAMDSKYSTNRSSGSDHSAHGQAANALDVGLNALRNKLTALVNPLSQRLERQVSTSCNSRVNHRTSDSDHSPTAPTAAQVGEETVAGEEDESSHRRNRHRHRQHHRIKLFPSKRRH